MVSKTKDRDMTMMPRGARGGGGTSTETEGGEGGCLICSSKIEARVPEGGEVKQQLEKAMRKVFKYLLVPDESWKMFGRGVVSGVPFCRSCFETVEDIMKLERMKDGIELKIQNKVEGLGRVVANTPPHLFLKGGGSQKLSLEMWKYFRDPVMQNFVKGKLPNPSVKMEMLSNKECGNVIAATSAQVKLTEAKVSKNEKNNNENEDMERDSGPEVVVPTMAKGPGPLQWKVRLEPRKRQQRQQQPRVNKGRVSKRKKSAGGKKRKGLLTRKKRASNRETVLITKRPSGLNKTQPEVVKDSNDESTADNEESEEESDLENLFEEIVVTRALDGGIRSLSQVSSPNKGNSNPKSCDALTKGPLSTSNRTSLASETSDTSSGLFKPVPVDGIKKASQDSNKIKDKSDQNDEMESNFNAVQTNSSRSSHSEGNEGMEFETERIPIPVENESTTVFSMICSTDQLISPRKGLGISGGGTIICTTGRENGADLTAELNRNLQNADDDSSATNRSPCIPVARNDELDIFAPIPCSIGDEHSHSQEIRDLMFSNVNDEQLLPNPDGDLNSILLPPMSFSPSHFGSDLLDNYIVENELNCLLD